MRLDQVNIAEAHDFPVLDPNKRVMRKTSSHDQVQLSQATLKLESSARIDSQSSCPG